MDVSHILWVAPPLHKSKAKTHTDTAILMLFSHSNLGIMKVAEML